MTSDQVVFAGVEFSSGRKPFTVAVLDQDLQLLVLEQWDMADAIACLTGYKNVHLVVNSPGTKAGTILQSEFRKQAGQGGFKPASMTSHAQRWSETNAEECFHAFQARLIARRTLQGRIQRALILHEEGLQFDDPMDYFEEITRYKLIQGHLPTETVYSTRQLDALVAAYMAWMAENRSGQVMRRGDSILPRITLPDEENVAA